MTDEEIVSLNRMKLFARSSDLSVVTAKDMDIVVTLVEKQSKEIEELKMITKEYDSFLGNEKIIIADKSYFDDGYFKEKFISKDKIKAKIEEYRHKDFIKMQVVMKHDKEALKIAEVLQSLLEKE